MSDTSQNDPSSRAAGSSQRDVLPIGGVAPIEVPRDTGSNSHPLIVVDDATVISSAPPLAAENAYNGLRPKELGEALLGQQLGDVVLEDFVGGGGMGAVFRGNDTVLHRSVAVKVLSTSQASDAESLRRFQTEARSAARLDHPGIARVFHVGEQQGLRYIVFEFIDGRNLRDYVAEQGPLPVADALNVTLQVADALVHAWNRQVVHRDIKPSNLLLSSAGPVKLVDMGLARLDHNEQTDNDATATGMTLGTFDYIAPEQARDPRAADTRADIYSLGCTLFYLLTGQPPFPGGTPLQKLLSHQGDAPPEMREFRQDVPGAVIEVLDRMLAKRPGDRFQDPMELVSALLGVNEQLGIEQPKLSATLFASVVPIESTSWTQYLPWAVPATALAVFVVVMLLSTNSAQPTAGFESDPLKPNVIVETPSESGE